MRSMTADFVHLILCHPFDAGQPLGFDVRQSFVSNTVNAPAQLIYAPKRPSRPLLNNLSSPPFADVDNPLQFLEGRRV